MGSCFLLHACQIVKVKVREVTRKIHCPESYSLAKRPRCKTLFIDLTR